MDMFDLSGKCALITGASGGIGAEIARVLHGAGATVTLSGTREDPLKALASDLGDRAHVLPCDLSDAEAVDALPRRWAGSTFSSTTRGSPATTSSCGCRTPNGSRCSM